MGLGYKRLISEACPRCVYRSGFRSWNCLALLENPGSAYSGVYIDDGCFATGSLLWTLIKYLLDSLTVCLDGGFLLDLGYHDQ